jgi:hypothetical protein
VHRTSYRDIYKVYRRVVRLDRRAFDRSSHPNLEQSKFSIRMLPRKNDFLFIMLHKYILGNREFSYFCRIFFSPLRLIVQIGLSQVQEDILMIEHLIGTVLIDAVESIDAVVGVEIRVGCDASGDVRDRIGACLVLLVVEHLELVDVRVAEKQTGYCRLVSIDNSIEVLLPRLEAVVWMDVSYDVNFFVGCLARLQRFG